MTEVADVAESPVYPFQRDMRCPFAPPPALEQLRRDDPISRVRLWDGTPAWLVTRYEDVRTLLVDPRLSSDVSRPGYPHLAAGVGAAQKAFRTFLNMDDPEHARHRRMLTRDFMIKRMQALRPRIQEHANAAVEELAARPQPADLVEAVALPVTSSMIAELLGVPADDHQFFQERTVVLGSGTATVEESLQASADVQEFFRELIERKRAHPTTDVISHLTALQDDDELTLDEALNMLRLLVAAGHDTTASMIALGTLTLLQHPEQRHWLMADPDARIAGAVEELLRYLTISHFGRRRIAVEDIEIGGRTIKAGDGVIAANDAANRDATAFPEPDALNLSRDARHHLTFGYGPHQCLGQPLARVELQVVYPTLFRRFPDLAPAEPLSSMRFKETSVFYGLHALPVTW